MNSDPLFDVALRSAIAEFQDQAERICAEFCARNYPEHKTRVHLKVDIKPLVVIDGEDDE